MRTRIATVGHVDHGKSTLIGRLLSDTGQAEEGRVRKARAVCEGGRFEYAFLLDALQEEQVQGVTIDVTEVRWRWGDREFVFIDTPGHREFIKNMVGGASKVDAVLLLVDASEKLSVSFHRQIRILQILGVKRLIVLINKMDLMDWSEDVWRLREREVLEVLRQVECEADLLPVSAWHGENLFARSEKMSWFKGATLVDALSRLTKTENIETAPPRFFVQDTYRVEDRRVHVGRLEAGEIRVGTRLHFHPSGLSGRVRSLEVYGETRARASAGDAIGLTLDEALYLDRGALGFTPEHPPHLQQMAEADVFWLGREPLQVGDPVHVKMGPRTSLGKMACVVQEIDSETFEVASNPSSLRLFGRVRIAFEQEFAFDPFETHEATGRFVLGRNNEIAGGGRWLSAPDASLDRAARESGGVVWFTGLSGAGKSTLARRLEAHLHFLEKKAIVLDGDVFRAGVSRDLDFSSEGRDENIRRAAEVAKILADQGMIVLAAFISPRLHHRALAREIIGSQKFFEIFVDCPVEVCQARDPKGLYAENVSHMTFENPAKPDLAIATAEGTVEHSFQKFLEFLKKRASWMNKND